MLLTEFCKKYSIKKYTVLYYVKKSENDYKDGLIDFNLHDFITKRQLTANNKSLFLFIDNQEKFKRILDKYLEYIKIRNQRKDGWTPITIECYEHSCICKDCLMKKYCEQPEVNYRLKRTVIELYRKYGKPQTLKTMEDIINE